MQPKRGLREVQYIYAARQGMRACNKNMCNPSLHLFSYGVTHIIIVNPFCCIYNVYCLIPVLLYIYCHHPLFLLHIYCTCFSSVIPNILVEMFLLPYTMTVTMTVRLQKLLKYSGMWESPIRLLV